MRFNELLILHHFHIIIHLLEWSQDDCLTLFVILWTTSTTEDLLHVENAYISVCTCSAIVHFSPLDQNTICR